MPLLATANTSRVNDDERAPSPPPSALDTASRLFSEVGYDGVTTEMLVASGIDPEQLAAAGGKAGLYMTIMEDIFERKWTRIQAALQAMDPTLDALDQLVDAYLDFCLENPAAVTLWTHRSLHDASDFADLEQRYIAPVRRLVLEKAKTLPVGIDPVLQVSTVVWCVHGFVAQGLITADGMRVRSDDPDAVALIRKHLHQLVRMMNS